MKQGAHCHGSPGLNLSRKFLALTIYKCLDINPMGKPRMTQRDRWKQRPVVSAYWAFRDVVRYQLSGREVGKLGGAVWFEFYVPMPRSWSRKKRLEMCGKAHTQRPDIDNFIKAMLDAMYVDDSGVWLCGGGKYWSEKGRVEIYKMKGQDNVDE